MHLLHPPLRLPPPYPHPPPSRRLALDSHYGLGALSPLRPPSRLSQGHGSAAPLASSAPVRVLHLAADLLPESASAMSEARALNVRVRVPSHRRLLTPVGRGQSAPLPSAPMPASTSPSRLCPGASGPSLASEPSSPRSAAPAPGPAAAAGDPPPRPRASPAPCSAPPPAAPSAPPRPIPYGPARSVRPTGGRFRVVAERRRAVKSSGESAAARDTAAVLLFTAVCRAADGRDACCPAESAASQFESKSVATLPAELKLRSSNTPARDPLVARSLSAHVFIPYSRAPPARAPPLARPFLRTRQPAPAPAEALPGPGGAEGPRASAGRQRPARPSGPARHGAAAASAAARVVVRRSTGAAQGRVGTLAEPARRRGQRSTCRGAHEGRGVRGRRGGATSCSPSLTSSN